MLIALALIALNGVSCVANCLLSRASAPSGYWARWQALSCKDLIVLKLPRSIHYWVRPARYTRALTLSGTQSALLS